MVLLDTNVLIKLYESAEYMKKYARCKKMLQGTTNPEPRTLNLQP